MCSIEVDLVKIAIALLYAVEKNLLVLKKYFFSKSFVKHTWRTKKSLDSRAPGFCTQWVLIAFVPLGQIPDLKKFEVEVVFVKNVHKTFDCTKKLEKFYWFVSLSATGEIFCPIIYFFLSFFLCIGFFLVKANSPNLCPIMAS